MKKVLIIGGKEISALDIMRFKEEFGVELEFVTLEQAQELQMNPSEFVNIPTFQIKNQPMLEELNEVKLTKAISRIDNALIYGRVGKGGRAQNRSKMNNFNQKQKRK